MIVPCICILGAFPPVCDALIFPNILDVCIHPSDNGRSGSGKSKKPRKIIKPGHGKRREERAATVPVDTPTGSVLIFVSGIWPEFPIP